MDARLNLLVDGRFTFVPAKYKQPDRHSYIPSQASPLLLRRCVAMADTGLKELVDGGLTFVPAKYKQPDRHSYTPSHASPLLSVPVLDLAPLSSSGDARAQLISEVGLACRDWGFFQVINHGVPASVVERTLAATQRFFDLPAEERNRYYLNDPRNKHASGVNWKETITCESESSAPPFCREAALEYKKEVKKLARTLYGAIVESLGVVPDMEQAEVQVANMMMHCYPPCPDPSITFGLTEHTDAGFITILLQDEVGGLEVMKNGEWVSCKPAPNAFTINVADQMEILCNGRYESVVHRVVTNAEKPRISIPCFMAPSIDGRTGPLPDLIDENNPALYKEVVFKDYLQHYMSVRIQNTARSGTDFAKVNPLPS